MRFGGLLTAACLILALNGIAFADDPTECIKQPAPFDGIKPLRYAAAVGASGGHIYIHVSFPTGCMPDKAATCSAPTYVIPGDVVAISKSCGVWSYVQYLGKSRVTTGWTATDQLQSLPPAAPAKNLEIEPNGLPDDPKRYPFELTKGHGVPVCEAYLQRLNTTEFMQPAFCGRPENDQVPGFGHLARKPMSSDEMDRLLDLLETVVSPVTDIDGSYYQTMNGNGGVFTGKPRHVERPVFSHPASWTYGQPVDIANSGHPDPVLIWNPDDSERPECGQSVGRVAPGGPGQVAFILSADGSTLDQARTIGIFGHPDGGFEIPAVLRPYMHDTTFLRSYRPIGWSYGVFRYRDLYYFDTLFNGDASLGDFENKRRGHQSLRDTLGVFLRRNDKTQQVCEYRLPTSEDHRA